MRRFGVHCGGFTPQGKRQTGVRASAGTSAILAAMENQANFARAHGCTPRDADRDHHRVVEGSPRRDEKKPRLFAGQHEIEQEQRQQHRSDPHHAIVVDLEIGCDVVDLGPHVGLTPHDAEVDAADVRSVALPSAAIIDDARYDHVKIDQNARKS